jgi:hypothetical protein
MANLSKRKIEAYYVALGRFVTVWAEVELFVDLLVVILAKPALPHQLSVKVSTIRKKLNGSQLRNAKAIMALLDEIEALSDTRHDYIHGSIIGHALTRTELTVTLARLLQPRKRPRRKPAKITVAQINSTANRLHQIGGELLDLVEAVNHDRQTVH